MKRLSIAVLSVTVVASLTIASPAQADPGGTDATTVTATETAQALAAMPDVLQASDTVRAVSDADSASTATINNTTVDVPRDPDAAVSLRSGDNPPIKIGLPNADEAGQGTVVAPGTVAYPSSNGAANAVQTTEDGGVRMLTVIGSASAPLRYPYPIEVPAGGRLQLDSDGGAVVLDAGGSYIGGIAKAWAKDAAGNAVPTHYEVDGLSLVQVVNHDAADVQYPVVADPWFGIALIDRVQWSGSTLRVYPTWWGRYGAGYLARWSAWGEVVKKAPGANRANMADQFYCHWDIVRVASPFKTSWNLDSGRPNVGYWETVRRQCNP